MNASDPASAAPQLRPIAWWLVVCAAMVFVMVILGGATRLTHSGLSMVQWKPLHILPPLSNAEWADEFHHYETSPEFQKVNNWMTVDDFKDIYWLEYTHRLWGRLIGFVFLAPFIVFALQRRIDKPLGWKLAGLFVLGGLQGVIGWLMVASGLEDRPSVSHFRLAAHLVTAFITYGAIVWVALDCFRRSGTRTFLPDRRLAFRAFGTVTAILLVVVWGAFTAGLHAGLIYNTFPLMDGRLIPKGLSNPLTDIMTVQFTHRVLAILLVVKIVGMWVRSRKAVMTPQARGLSHAVLGMAFVQAALGISTLLLVVPLPLALAHQTGALILFTLGISLTHELTPYSTLGRV